MTLPSAHGLKSPCSCRRAVFKKVSKKALLIQTDEVFHLLHDEITSTVQKNSRADNLASKNNRRIGCLKIKEKVSSNNEEFIDAISAENKKGKYRESDLKSFQYQFERSRLYWASILFEAVFLPLWWLFIFHGGVFGKYNRKLSVRLAFSPLILFTPHYLGYAPYLFLFGPSGGILYPLFAVLVGIPFGWVPFNPIEIEILKVLPQPLLFISQVPASPMAISFMGSVSPTVLCAYAFMVFVAGIVIGKYRAKRGS